MTENIENNQQEITAISNKEENLGKIRLKYERELAIERAKREEIEKQRDELSRRHMQQPQDDDEDDSEPYVDHKRLEKKLNKFAEKSKTETQSEIQRAVSHALKEEKQKNFIKNNPDFFDVLENAEQLYTKDPELAEAILEMPQGFERQKLVYKSIKALEVNKPIHKEPSIQEKIDANRRGPYYQPSGVGASPYNSASDFSASGQKNAYDKMKELQARLRL